MSTADKQRRDKEADVNRRKVVRITSPAAKRPHAGSALSPALPTVPGGPSPSAGSVMLAELEATGFIGMWQDREEIQDSTEFVQHLRDQIQARADRSTPGE
jgi:hypothetical protein